MILFSQACKIAYDYYSAAWQVRGLSEALDLGQAWLFYPRETAFGQCHITVDKAAGTVAPFLLPDRENFALLKKARKVEIPPDFRQ